MQRKHRQENMQLPSGIASRTMDASTKRQTLRQRKAAVILQCDAKRPYHANWGGRVAPWNPYKSLPFAQVHSPISARSLCDHRPQLLISKVPPTNPSLLPPLSGGEMQEHERCRPRSAKLCMRRANRVLAVVDGTVCIHRGEIEGTCSPRWTVQASRVLAVVDGTMRTSMHERR